MVTRIRKVRIKRIKKNILLTLVQIEQKLNMKGEI